VDAIDTFDIENLSVEILHDDTCMDLEDALGECEIKLCSFEPHSTLSDLNEFGSAEEILAECKKGTFTPFLLYKYEHGQVMYTAVEAGGEVGYPFSDRWDAGCVGFILVPVEGYDEPLEAANSYLSSVTDWCNGSIYGYTIADDDGEQLDSCWGFVGFEWVEQAAKEAAQALLEHLPKQLEIAGLSV